MDWLVDTAVINNDDDMYCCQGNVGILDVSTRNYTTVMRSHVGHVLSVSVDPQRRHIATVSDDRTIRIWDFDTLQQVLSTGCQYQLGFQL